VDDGIDQRYGLSAISLVPSKTANEPRGLQQSRLLAVRNSGTVIDAPARELSARRRATSS